MNLRESHNSQALHALLQRDGRDGGSMEGENEGRGGGGGRVREKVKDRKTDRQTSGLREKRY